jgi:hypothetical protein
MNKLDKERFEVVYLYVIEFEYGNVRAGERFNYEPSTGKVYRAIKDKKGGTYRVPLSNDTDATEGIIFDKLIDSNAIWTCQIVEVTFDNIKDIKIPNSEVKKLMDWEGDPEDNQRLLEWALTPPEELEEDDEYEVILEEDEDVRSTESALKELMDNYLKVASGRDGVADVTADLIEYLKTTYSDKYTDTSSPLDTKAFTYHPQHGTAVNMFCASKYMQRYMTNGYSKSNNPVDLFKAIHYLLFELARLKITSYVENKREQKAIGGGDRNPKRPNMGSENGSEKTSKAPRRKRGRPPKSDKG